MRIRAVRLAARARQGGYVVAIASIAFLTTGQDRVLAASDADLAREVKLLRQKIDLLERKLEKIEAKADTAVAASKSRSSGGSGDESGGSVAVDSVAGGAPPAGAADATYQTDGNSAEKKTKMFGGLISEEDREGYLSLYVARDEAVVLEPNKFEVRFGFDYSRVDGFLQFSRGLATTAEIRYGLMKGVEISAATSYMWTYRRSPTGQNSILEGEISSPGDINLRVNATVLRENMYRPGIVLYGGLTIPTGKDPYRVSLVNGNQLPMDTTVYSYKAGGHYIPIAGATFFKTYDPFAFFAGFNLSYPIERSIAGTKVQPGIKVGYTLGTSYVVSPRTTLGTAINGYFQSEFKVNGATLAGTVVEPMSIRLSLIHQLAKDLIFDSGVAFGVTEDAPDVELSLGVRRKF